MTIPPPAKLDPETALDAFHCMVFHGVRDLVFEAALLRTLMKSPNWEVAMMAKCMVAQRIADGRIELDDELPPDFAELMAELQAGRLGREH